MSHLFAGRRWALETTLRMRRSWRSTLLIALVASGASGGCAAVHTLGLPSELRRAPVPSETLRRQHDAVFDLLMPADDLAMADTLKRMAHGIRDSMWVQFSTSQKFLEAMTLLTRLDVLGGQSSQVRAFLGRTGKRRMDQLSPEQRAELLMLAQTCESNDLRKLALQGRSFYLANIYGTRLGPSVAGMRPKPTMHPAVGAYVRDNLPRVTPGWLTYDDRARQVRSREGRIDYIIVGSGPAGSVIAHELRAAGFHTLLVDKGPFVVPGAMDTRAYPQLKESRGVRTTASGSVLLNNAQAVGGGTAINIDLAFSPAEEIVAQRIDRWRDEGRIAVDAFTRPEVGRAYEWVREMVGTRTPAEGEINANNAALWNGALKRGLHPKLYDLNTRPPGQWTSPVSDKRSAVSGLLIGAMSEPTNPLALIPDAEVLRILSEERHGTRVATGVKLRILPSWDAPGVIRDPAGLGIAPGDTVTVHADHVILSAGTLGSATLLLRSRIHNRNIGRGIVIHPAMPVIGRFDHVVDALEGTEATVHVDDYALSHGFLLEAMAAGPLYAALMTPGEGHDVFNTVSSYRHLAGFGILLIDTPSSSNCITLNQAGEPVVHYELSAADRKRFQFAVAEAVRIMLLAGAREVILPTAQLVAGGRTVTLTRMGQADSLAQRLTFRPNETVLTSAHMQSSNKMGKDPGTSVVSPDALVWGFQNLYVMDSSIFPSSIGANPMQSIYTFAKLFAERLIEEHARSTPHD